MNECYPSKKSLNIKKRYDFFGFDNEIESRLVSQLDTIVVNFRENTVHIFLVNGCTADGRGSIEISKMMLPTVTSVFIYSGKSLDVSFKFENNKWNLFPHYLNRLHPYTLFHEAEIKNMLTNLASDESKHD